MTESTPPFGRPERWNPDKAPPSGQRAALHRLAAALREANALMMDTSFPEDDLVAAAELAEHLLAKLQSGPGERTHFGFAESANAGNTRAFFDGSPLIGLGNPVSPPLSLRLEGSEVIGRGSFGPQYEGPPGHVHGGIIAAAFDEVLGMVQSMSGNPGMTGTLVVRYRRPTPLRQELLFRGHIDRVEGRKIFTSATLHFGDELCAESDGIFIGVPAGKFQALAEHP